MTWELYPARAKFREHAADWNALNADLYSSHPFLDTRFVIPLIDHFADADVVLALSRGAGGTPAGMVLLRPRNNGIWSTFQPSQAQIAPSLLAWDVELSELFPALPGVNIMLELLCQDPECSPFSGECQVPRTVLIKNAETISIAVQGSFEEYWNRRSKNLRKSIARRLTKWQERLQFIEHTETGDILEALVRYGDLESRGWKGNAGTAIHSSNSQGQFYADVLWRFGADGHAAIHELYVDGHLGASQITLTNGRMIVMLKTTFEESLADCAPGRLLQYFLLKHIFDQQRSDQVEYYTNANAEQVSWCTEHRPINHVMMFRFAWVQFVWNTYRRLRRA